MSSLEKISEISKENPKLEQGHKNEKSITERVEMGKIEKRRFLERFNNVPKTVRALMSAFILSTSINLSMVNAYEKDVYNIEDGQYIVKVIDNAEKEFKITEGMIRQKLYSVTDKETGKTAQFYASSLEDAVEFGLEFVKPLDETAKEIVERERWLQQSGFTDPTDAYKGPIRVSDGGKDYPRMPNLSKIVKELSHFTEEIKELPENATFIKTHERVDIYRNGNKEEDVYTAVSRLTGRKIMFESPSEDEAVNYGSALIKLSPYEQVVLDYIKQEEQSLKEYGWADELSYKKYGMYIPNSEIIKNDKTTHTEARRFYDPESEFDVIAES